MTILFCNFAVRNRTESSFCHNRNQEIRRLGRFKKVRLDEISDLVYFMNTKDIKFPLEYKYLIVDSKTDEDAGVGRSPNRRVEKVDARKRRW